MLNVESAGPPVPKPPSRGLTYYRHRLPVRIMHWINVLCLTILFMSGLGIFNAHPALYWGQSSYTGQPAFLEITSISRPAPVAGMKQENVYLPVAAAANPGAVERRGMLRIGDYQFDTTGWLGVSKWKDGSLNEHAFPHWLTIPGYYSLALARSWHFFFAWLFVINGVAYVMYTILSGHLARDLAPDGRELRGIGASIKDHLLLRHPAGEAARRYNVLQKLAYLVVIFVLLPLIVLMGMAMSPALDTLITGWVNWFGGRQSARTIHFIVAWLLLAFVLIHVFEVIISGFWNHLRSMITGYYTVDSVGTERTEPRHPGKGEGHEPV